MRARSLLAAGAFELADRRRSPAHCGTLTTRVLRNSRVYIPAHPPAFYGPSTLFRELSDCVAVKAMASPDYQGMSSDTTARVDTLLRAPMSSSTIEKLGDAACLDAVHALTLRVVDASRSADETARRITQKQLATALLRWVVLRDPAPVQPPE